MQSLLLLLSVAGYFYFFCVYSKCKLIQAPFYLVTFIICTLYVFAITGYLELGAYTCLAFGLFLGVVTAYLNKNYYLIGGYRSIFTKNNSYELCYLIPLIVIVFLIPSNYQFMDWDEFSFWGLSIKIISTTDSLYNASSPTEYNHYPPGQQLFQYFIIKFTGWSENNALYSHIILSFSILFYIAGSFYKHANFKTVLSFFTASILMYYLGFAYASVYSDKIVALYFCAAMVCAYFTRNNVINLIFLCFVLMTLVLIKQIGLLMALLVVVIYCISNVPHSNLNTYSKNKRVMHYFYSYRFLAISIMCLLASICFSYQSWKWYVDSIGASKNYYIPTLVEFLEGERLEMLNSILSEFIRRIQLPGFMVFERFGLSLLNTTFIFLAISLIGIILCERNKRIQLSAIFVVIFMGWIGYIVFHLYAYQVFFGQWEALHLSSFERYAAIYCLSWMLFIYFVISSRLLELKSKIASSVLLAFCCVTFIGVYQNVRGDLVESFTTYNYAILQRINADKALVNEHVKNEESVYFVAQGATAYDRWAFYYAVYPKMKKFNSWSLCPVTDWYACADKKFSEALIGSNYLMLSKADDYFWEQAGHLFDSAEYGAQSGLYAVEYKDGVVVKLTKVNKSFSK